MVKIWFQNGKNSHFMHIGTCNVHVDHGSTLLGGTAHCNMDWCWIILCIEPAPTQVKWDTYSSNLFPRHRSHIVNFIMVVPLPHVYPSLWVCWELSLTLRLISPSALPYHLNEFWISFWNTTKLIKNHSQLHTENIIGWLEKISLNFQMSIILSTHPTFTTKLNTL